MDLSFLMVFKKKNIDPTDRQNFGDAPGQIPKLILTLCHTHTFDQKITSYVALWLRKNKTSQNPYRGGGSAFYDFFLSQDSVFFITMGWLPLAIFFSLVYLVKIILYHLFFQLKLLQNVFRV